MASANSFERQAIEKSCKYKNFSIIFTPQYQSYITYAITKSITHLRRNSVTRTER